MSWDLLIRAAAHDTIISRSVIQIQETNTIERYMKCQMLVRITKKTGKHDDFRHNPDYLPGTYMTEVLEAQYFIGAKN